MTWSDRWLSHEGILVLDSEVFSKPLADDETAAEAVHRPAAMSTSGIDDMSKLCGDRVRLVPA